MKQLFTPTHTKVKNLQWALHLFIIPAIYFGDMYYWLTTLIVFWLMHGLGSGIGAHRFYTHKTFTTSKVWEIIMSFCFTVSCTGSTVGYTLMHLKHHGFSDQDKDPHNPEPNFWKTWWGIYDETKLVFGPKVYARLMSNPIMNFFHRNYFLIIISYVLLLALINPMLIIFAFAIPAVMQFQTNAILIALVHSPKSKFVGGYRNFETTDRSVNIWWLKPLLLGEELHNNHHGMPSSITMNSGRGWKDFDPLYYVIKYVICGKETVREV